MESTSAQARSPDEPATGAGIDRTEAQRSRLRTLQARMQAETSRLPDPAPGGDDLRASVAELAGVLALGPELEVRSCPVCKGVCMRTATLCGSCWTRLTP